MQRARRTTTTSASAKPTKPAEGSAVRARASKRIPAPKAALKGLVARKRVYDVDRLAKKIIRKGEPHYEVKWKNWPSTKNTVEPEDALMETCADIIRDFNEQNELLGILPEIEDDEINQRNTNNKKYKKRKHFSSGSSKRKRAKVVKRDAKSSDQVTQEEPTGDTGENTNSNATGAQTEAEAAANGGNGDNCELPFQPFLDAGPHLVDTERDTAGAGNDNHGDDTGSVSTIATAETEGDHGYRANDDLSFLNEFDDGATYRGVGRAAPPPRELLDLTKTDEELEREMFEKPVLVDYTFKNLPFAIHNVMPLGSDVVYCLDLVDNQQKIQRRLIVGSTLRSLSPDLIIEYYEQRLSWVRDPFQSSQQPKPPIPTATMTSSEPMQGPSRLSFPPRWPNEEAKDNRNATEEGKSEDTTEKTYLAPKRDNASSDDDESDEERERPKIWLAEVLDLVSSDGDGD